METVTRTSWAIKHKRHTRSLVNLVLGTLWYLVNPSKYIVGTKMVFAGIKKPAERAYLIEFIKSAQ